MCFQGVIKTLVYRDSSFLALTASFCVFSLVAAHAAPKCSKRSTVCIESTVKSRHFGDIVLVNKKYFRLIRTPRGLVGKKSDIFALSKDKSVPGVVISALDKRKSLFGLAKLQRSDIIERVNLTTISSHAELFSSVKALNNGRVVIGFKRNGLSSSVAVEIEA